MGNSASTLQIYEEGVDQSMKDKIKGSARQEFEAALSQQDVAQYIAAATNGGTDYKAIEAASDDRIDVFMSMIAMVTFPVMFHYEYNDDPALCKPPLATGGSKPISGFCSVSTPLDTQILGYLEAEVFSKLGLPTWVKQQATAELVALITMDVRNIDSQEPEWFNTYFHRTYDSPVGDQGSWRLDTQMTIVKGALTFDGLRAGFAMIYFRNVAYPAQSSNKPIHDDIRREAFASAARLAGGPTPTTDAQLSDTLKQSGTTTFQSEFGFSYGSIPPESWRAEGVSSAYLNSTIQLMYLPVLNPQSPLNQEYVSTFIEQGLFSNLDVPVSSVKKGAINDFTADSQRVLAESAVNSWATSSIDYLYHLADPTLNPIRQKSVLMLWYWYGLDSLGYRVPATYIFVQTVFYEELPVERRAVKRLFQILCDKIRQELQKPPVPDDDLLSLKAMLIEYASMKFYSSFGFAYDGNNSNPPDRRPGGAIKGYDELLQTKNTPTSAEEVEKWLDAEVFQKDSLTFPAFANNKIWEKIRDDVVGFTKVTTSENWYTASNSTVYLHPDGGTNIKQYSQYVYAVGELELDGVKVTRVYVCYLGVYCGTTKTS